MLLIGEVQKGNFKSGTRSLGLKEDGLSLGPFDDSLVNPSILQRLQDLKNKIIQGEIVIQTE
jgi:basic membrane protein A